MRKKDDEKNTVVMFGVEKAVEDDDDVKWFIDEVIANIAAVWGILGLGDKTGPGCSSQWQQVHWNVSL